MDKPKSVGIIGGGQLGMMLLEAAKNKSNEVKYTTLEASADCPVRPLTDHFILGSLKDADAIKKLSEVSDVMTWEIEHIDVKTLISLEDQGQSIIPKPSVLEIIGDKGTQKKFYESNHVPTAPFKLMSKDNLEGLNELRGERVVVKSRTGGYDGKGVSIVKKVDLFNGYAPFDGDWMVEEFVENVKELAIIVAVDTNGGEITYPSIDMYFNPESNLVEFLYSPSVLDAELLIQAEQIAKQAVSCLNSPGLFAVELFITAENEIWVNEMAPRPHNSGHHTIEGCVTSQFAQLNNILLGENVGSTDLIKPSAMINVVGPEGWEGSYQLENKEIWDASEDVFVHLYNKSVSKPHRKLGHVTVVSDDVDSLIQRAREVQKELRIIPS